MNGPEIPPTMSVSRSGFGLGRGDARIRHRCIGSGWRPFINHRAIEQARLPGNHDLVTDVKTFGDHGLLVAAFTDLDRPDADLAIVADHIGKKTGRSVLHAILRHDDDLLERIDQHPRIDREAGPKRVVLVIKTRFQTDGSGGLTDRIVHDHELALRQRLGSVRGECLDRHIAGFVGLGDGLQLLFRFRELHGDRL